MPLGDVFSCQEPDVGATCGAGVWLGMKAPVGRISVFFFALVTHGETGHAGGGAVVRNGADDAVAGAAIGAVGKGVVKAPVGGVEDIGEALVAHGDIGADENIVPLVARTFTDDKIIFVHERTKALVLMRGDNS